MCYNIFHSERRANERHPCGMCLLGLRNSRTLVHSKDLNKEKSDEKLDERVPELELT